MFAADVHAHIKTSAHPSAICHLRSAIFALAIGYLRLAISFHQPTQRNQPQLPILAPRDHLKRNERRALIRRHTAILLQPLLLIDTLTSNFSHPPFPPLRYLCFLL